MKRMNEVFELPVDHEVFAVDGHTAKNGEGLTARLEADLHAAHAINNVDALADALERLFEEYKQIADSGDAGNWKAEETPEGELALAVLNAYRGAK